MGVHVSVTCACACRAGSEFERVCNLQEITSGHRASTMNDDTLAVINSVRKELLTQKSEIAASKSEIAALQVRSNAHDIDIQSLQEKDTKTTKDMVVFATREIRLCAATKNRTF